MKNYNLASVTQLPGKEAALRAPHARDPRTNAHHGALMALTTSWTVPCTLRSPTSPPDFRQPRCGSPPRTSSSILPFRQAKDWH
jgi:hypothetical protein